MYIVLGATGHVGSSVVRSLRQAGQPVTAVTRDARRAASLQQLGAQIAELDVRDVAGLRRVLATGTRAFLLNPPAPPDTDTDAEERATAHAIASALEGSTLEKVVAESTYGARPGRRIGDLSVLYELEQALRRTRVPTTITRGAYYFSNLDGMLEPARDRGIVPTMMPADLRLPMVAPVDIGMIAADLLQRPAHDFELVYVEGPTRVSFSEVAQAFASALGKSIEPVVTPRAEWEQTFRELGFSAEAAASYANMTAATIDDGIEAPEEPLRGGTTLQSYVRALVASA
jgi:uncharacterized protein YbjT (DUF2867 family)